jgi:hypothetical protein
MRSRIARIRTATAAGVLLVAMFGCGFIGAAKNLVATAQVLADFGDRLSKSATLTYTAQYQATDGTKVTFVQQPPNAAYQATEGSYIFTKDYIYLCGTTNGKTSCTRTPNQSADVTAADAGSIGTVAGAGFITPELALGLVAAAALVPGAKATESNKTIAGQQSLCVTVTGLDAAASPGDTQAPRDFSVCVTDVGILASFSGTLTSGQKGDVTLVSYSATADSAAFQPPAGAQITDTGAIVATAPSS